MPTNIIIHTKNMRKKTLLILILLMVAMKSSAFSIEGQWRLTDVQQSRLSNQTQLKVQIKEFVFRQKTVRWSLSLQGCSSLKVMMDISGNNIFIDMKTIYVSSQQSQNCTSAVRTVSKRFQNLLKKVYLFQIIYNFMIFSDPEGRVIFKFQRVLVPKPANPFLGTWIAKLGSTQNEDQMVEISEKEIVFCQRQAALNYNLIPNNILKFSNKQSISKCVSNRLFSLVDTPIYFAIRNNSIELYNQTDNFIGSLQFVMDIEKSIKLRQQQKSREAAESKKPSVSIGMADLIGKWEITSVFQGPNILDNMVFIISSRIILISSNCNTFTFTYTASGVDPIKVKRQNFAQTNNQCENDVQKIYKNGLVKMSAIKAEVQGDKIVSKILDEKNKQLFSIQKAFISQPVLSSASTDTQRVVIKNPISAPTKIQKKQDTVIKNGRYTILLLKNRDIPRKIIDIIKDSFSFQICNQIKITFTGSQKELKVASQTVKSNSCDTSLQDIYLRSFQKITSFQLDEGDVFLLGKNQEQIIALNFITDL